MNKSLIWIFLFVITIITSCVLIPIPTGEKALLEENIVKIQTGVTTKDEVLYILGRPDRFSDDGNFVLYSYFKFAYEVYGVWIYPWPGARKVTQPWVMYYVAILFDDKNCVKKIMKRNIPILQHNDPAIRVPWLENWFEEIKKSQSNR
jgi:outer membrane protein assembly factor BamE (lipoprotein component of BamABCDE complex)